MRNILLWTLIVMTVGCTDRVTKQPAPQPAESAKINAQEPSAQKAGATKAFWPRWRGAADDGISRETEWTSDWTKSEPVVSWRANVGTGFSSFAIVNGNAFTMGHRDGKDSVYCLDAQSGDEKWSHSYDCVLNDNLHEGGPGATPTIDEARVYTLSKQGHLFCLHAATGDVIWRKMVPDVTGVAMPEWGFTSSPYVHDNLVLVDGGRLVAFDKASGERRWQTDKYRPGYGTPVVFQHKDQVLAAVLNNDGFLSVRADTGEKVAFFPWKTDFATNSTTPIVVGDNVFISTGYQRGCALLKHGDGGLEVIYANKGMSNHFNNSVLWEDHVYGISGNSHSSRNCKLVCMELATGKIKWSQRGFGCGSLLLANGKLIVLSDSGDLVIATATPTEFAETSRTSVLEGRCWTVPVLVGGRIYCRNAAGDIVCLDVRKPS